MLRFSCLVVYVVFYLGDAVSFMRRFVFGHVSVSLLLRLFLCFYCFLYYSVVDALCFSGIDQLFVIILVGCFFNSFYIFLVVFVSIFA